MPHDRKNNNKMQCLILTPISRSARVLQDPLSRNGTSHIRARRGRHGRRPQEWSPAPRITQLAHNRKTSDIRLQPVSVASTASPASAMRTYVGDGDRLKPNVTRFSIM